MLDTSINLDNATAEDRAHPAQPSEPIPEAISKEVLRERERCIQIVWANRDKFKSNCGALVLMRDLNGSV